MTNAIDIHCVRLVATELRGRIVTAALCYGSHEKGYWDSTLGGLCAVASDLLIRTLQARGITSKLVCGNLLFNDRREGGSHCWVECGGYIVDVTATQFGAQFPEVFILSVQNSRHQIYWPLLFGDEAYAHVMMSDWPAEQQPGALDAWLEPESVLVPNKRTARETP